MPMKKISALAISGMGNILALVKNMFSAVKFQRLDPVHFSVFWIWCKDPACTLQVSKYTSDLVFVFREITKITFLL